MVQFGQTLNEKVKGEWRSHAVPYNELKQILRTTQNGEANSVHTESSYSISTAQKAAFGRMYERAVVKLVAFYEDKSQWARSKSIELEQEVTLCLRAPEGVDISGLIDRLSTFSKEVGLVLEFLELNVMACSKITKKFDKRTGSTLRASKMQRLKTNHHFLFDGGALTQIKSRTDDGVRQLYFLYAKLRSKKATNVKAPPIIEFNPQESDSSKSKSVSWDEQVRGGSVGVGSIHETKESKFITNCIDKVNEELKIQRIRSPFFDALPPRNSPPSFECNEIKLNKVLGAGEYCRIHEVASFSVPESCHICFMHRGFEEPSSSEGLPSNTSENSTLSSGSTPKKVVEIIDNTDNNMIPKSNEDSPMLLKKTLASSPNAPTGKGHKRVVSWDEIPKVISSFESSKTLTTAERQNMNRLPKTSHHKLVSCFSFVKDDNISDYDELEEDHEDEFDHETRGFMKDHCLREGEARYAVKRVKHELEGEGVVDAAIDLAREAQFLAGLSHPGIIKIRGTVGVPGHPRYAIVLDRLFDTLEVRIQVWKEQVKQSQGFMSLFHKNKATLKKNWIDRLLCAYDISHAMNYLHSRGMLHRDLKPANIGFDVRGDIKIFDLGLAKELKPSQKVGTDQYHTSGIAGTRRYMAPEVAQVMPYGLSADVYSYGILVWEMLTLQPAFHNYSRAKHFKEVIVEGRRPKIPRSWPFVEQNLLKRCWAPTPTDRPTFQAICQLIKFGLPDESFESTRSVDLAMRSIRSTGRNISNYPTKRTQL